MNEQERAALAALRFNWAPVPDDVWRPLPFHVDGLHPAVVRDLRDGIADARASTGASPIGVALQGQRGAGKTHLLGWTRQLIQEQGGYFFLVGLLDAKGFWGSVLSSILDGLSRPVPDSETQLRLLLRRLSSMVGAPRSARRAVIGETELTRPALDAFIAGLGSFDRHVARSSQETARALALSASDDVTHRDVAENYFVSGEESVPGERAAWGMRRAPRTPQEIVHDLSSLLALTGPSVVAVDQIDTLIAQSALSTDHAASAGDSSDDWQQLLLLERIAGGLMSLREGTHRTLTVVACLPASWALIKDKATDTVTDRFRPTIHLQSISDSELGRAIIEKRFATHFGQVGFVPPYPSWPIHPDALREVAGFTPRQLLITADSHIRACLLTGQISELKHLGTPPTRGPHAAIVPATAGSEDLAHFDTRFEALKKNADITTPLERESEDASIPGLLSAGLIAWVLERGEKGEAFTQDPPPSASPALHARLRLTLNEGTEDQVHWCFRAISDQHHAVAALNRIRRACTAAGLDEQVPKRMLFLLRNDQWSGGAKTREAVEALKKSHGRTLTIDNEDLRVLVALKTLLDENPVDLPAWLVARKPTADIAIFQEALADADAWPSRGTPADVQLPAETVELGPVPTFTIGHDYGTGVPALLALEALRKHTAIFAGSGSGKTVLIRRIVEECAIQGVSSIVLDPNNDLARLGDAWPEPPAQWGSGDAAKAADYLEHTDVVVWTPRRESGRPLTFQPLPDFRSVVDDTDEFNEAVDAAVAALAPRAMLSGRASKSHLGLAVLRKAVEYYGQHGGSRLKGLIDTLAAFPDGIIDLDGAEKIAAGLAQTLTAAMVNDPLFGGDGTPMDPGILLTPRAGKRARISVISLIGLPSDDVRQSFVNQLEMALFAWIKRHPAGDRPLLGLLVLDEAQTLAPSGAMTACTQSTLALASQARKYGLGLIFATQAPKGLHNRIPGNAATQLFGLLNSPIQIEAARDMAKAKGGDVPDISRLSTGEFYLAAEGKGPTKIRTPLCLSYHPKSPLTTEEVLERARTPNAGR
jgi:hypothetical protein